MIPNLLKFLCLQIITNCDILSAKTAGLSHLCSNIFAAKTLQKYIYFIIRNAITLMYFYLQLKTSSLSSVRPLAFLWARHAIISLGRNDCVTSQERLRRRLYSLLCSRYDLCRHATLLPK